jgi:hypothetical protein
VTVTGFRRPPIPGRCLGCGWDPSRLESDTAPNQRDRRRAESIHGLGPTGQRRIGRRGRGPDPLLRITVGASAMALEFRLAPNNAIATRWRGYLAGSPGARR